MPEIRPARAEDAPGVLAIYAPIVLESSTSFELEPPTVEEMAARMAGADEAHPWLVAVEGDPVAGYAYATRFRGRPAYDRTVETSVYVHPDHLRRGIARALYTALFERLRAAGHQRVIAGVTLPNDASVAFHEGFGFTPVGVFHDVGFKFRRYWSVGFWERSVQGSR